jgi:putative hydroxymethylpyrimidine transporter CytX
MQIGAYLVPAVGTLDAMLAIVIGSVLGAGLLAWVAKIGCDTGLSSAGLMHQVFGSAFARMPVLLNIVQLIGWTTFELVVMRDGTLAMAADSAWASPVLTTLLWGGVLTLLMMASMLTLVRKALARYALPLVVLSLLWITYQFSMQLSAQGLQTLWQRPGDGSMGWAGALDLVIAMPVSWLPLVADYARFGRSARGTMGGTWLGYGLANIWCYGLGVMVASVAAPGADLVTVLLLAQGGLIALSLILVDEIDNAYGDVHSAAVGAQALLPRWSVRLYGPVIAGLCTLLALVLPMHDLEPFLIMLSSVFVPLFGVMLGRLACAAPASLPRAGSVNWIAAMLWIGGIAVYHAISQWAPGWGAALPTLLVTIALAKLSSQAPSSAQSVAQTSPGKT